jgi:opine dehydrogenase
MNITIIGCGHGGCALAADLTQKGQQVTLYADEAHPGYSKQIKNKQLTLTGELQGKSLVHRLTNNIKEAINEAEIIYIALPTNAHLNQFHKMIPYLKKGQTILTLAGNFSSIYFYKELCKYNKEELVYLADLASLPYACRIQASGEIQIIAVKKSMEISAMPAIHTATIVKKISDHFPSKLTQSKHIIELGLNITSAISHPTIMLMNAGRIGKKQDDFYFYSEGISPEIAKVIHKIDQDRQNIGRKYGLKLPSYLELMNKFYNTKFKSYYEFFTQSDVHNKLKLCPTSINERYLSQDVPDVLLPWYSLGCQVGYESSTIRSIIDLASLLNSKNYYKQGRYISTDIFSNMSASDICEFVTYGYLTKSRIYLGAA